MEPRVRFELTTPALRKLCSTAELPGRLAESRERSAGRGGVNRGPVLYSLGGIAVQASKPTESLGAVSPGAQGSPGLPPAVEPSRCPRCSAQVLGDYKFCPTCAYRLRVDKL